MRKKIWIPILVLTIGLLISCENQNILPSESAESQTVADSTAMTESQKDVISNTDSEKEPVEPLSEKDSSKQTGQSEQAGQTEQNQPADYLEALSSEELEAARSLAEKFYTEEFPHDLISLKPADNTDPFYRENIDYEPGSIIIFLAETTHAGEGIYRKIVFVKEAPSSEWKQINEGY